MSFAVPATHCQISQAASGKLPWHKLSAVIVDPSLAVENDGSLVISESQGVSLISLSTEETSSPPRKITAIQIRP